MWRSVNGLGFALAVSLPLAAATIEVGVAAAGPGSSVFIPLTLHTEGASLTGVQFDLAYDREQLSLSLLPGQAARNATKLVYQVDQSRVMIIGWNREPITDGTLLILHARLTAAPITATVAVQIQNLVATDADAANVPITGTDGAVQIRLTSPVTPLIPEGVLNSASLSTGAIAPGELTTLLLAAPNSMSEITVRFNDATAPILYAGADQINTMVPDTLSGTNARIEVRFPDGSLAQALVGLASSAPGIFTVDGSGAGQANLINASDGSLNSPSNPVARNSEILVYATGAGRTDSDSFAVILPVGLRIGDVDATVLEAISLPEVIGGLIQIRASLPENTPIGPAVPVVLTVGSASSPRGVTMAVQ